MVSWVGGGCWGGDGVRLMMLEVKARRVVRVRAARRVAAAAERWRYMVCDVGREWDTDDGASGDRGARPYLR